MHGGIRARDQGHMVSLLHALDKSIIKEGLLVNTMAEINSN